MDITDIKFKDYEGNDKGVLAVVDIVIDYSFKINGILYKTGSKGEYIIFPKDKVGRDIVYPITNDYREYIFGCVDSAYTRYKMER